MIFIATRMKTHPLDIKFGWLPLVVHPISIYSALVDPVELSLVVVQVRFSQ